MTQLPDDRTATFLTEDGSPEPAELAVWDDRTRAATAAAHLRTGYALWTGDFRNGRHFLKALERRLLRSARRTGSLAERWRAERERKGELAEQMGRLLLLIDADQVVNKRAPDTVAAVQGAWGTDEGLRLVPFRTLLGALSAQAWVERGVSVPGLAQPLVPAYGVFSPTRQVYLTIMDGLDPGERVLDVGCGTGVIGLRMLAAGASEAIGVDQDPRAVACASANAARMGRSNYRAERGDLFSDGRFDRVVFNAPWMPEAPRTRLDRAVFDEGGAIVRRFLAGVRDHLTPDGRAWLIVSDLPVRLGLRPPDELRAEIAAAGLEVVQLHERPASHKKTRRTDDPLHAARAGERVQLWELR